MFVVEPPLTCRTQGGDRAGGKHSGKGLGGIERQPFGDVLAQESVEDVDVLQAAGAQRVTGGDQVHPAPLGGRVGEEVVGEAVRRGLQRVEQRFTVRTAGEEQLERGLSLAVVGEEHVLLRREVTVERSGGNIHRVGDVVDGGGLDTALGEQFQRSVDERLPRLDLLALATSDFVQRVGGHEARRYRS